MKQKNYNSCTVGQIVAGNFDTTKVFSRYHIDFCCHGNTPFAEACRNRGIDPEAVARELNELQENTVSNAPDFARMAHRFINRLRIENTPSGESVPKVRK